MYKGFIEKLYKESKTQSIYLRTEFSKLSGIGQIIFDIDLIKELDSFIQSHKSIENEENLIKYIQIYEVQQILPQIVIEKLLAKFSNNNVNRIQEEFEQNSNSKRQSINRVREQTQIEEIKFVTQMQLISEKKSLPSQSEIIEEVRQPDSIVQVINLKQYMGRSSVTIRAKLFYRPPLEKDQLETVLGDYSLQFKDNTGIVQALFIKQRLREKFKLFFEQLQIQCIYDIQNFEFHMFKQTYEIKVTSETQFNLVYQIPVVEQLQLAILSNVKLGEEVIVPAVVAEIGDLKQTNRRLILYTIPKEGSIYYKIPLILWDHHKNENFSIGEACVFEGVLFKSYGDQVELKSIRTRFKILRADCMEYKDILQTLNIKSKSWLIPKNNEVQIEQVQINPIFVNSIHQYKESHHFNTVVKVLKEMPSIFSLKEQKFIKQIQVTSDNFNIQRIDLFGERLCSKIYICENAIIYISFLKWSNQLVFADENNTQIRILPSDDVEFQELVQNLQLPFQRPQLLSQNELEPEQVLVQLPQQKKSQPIKIKIAEKKSREGTFQQSLKKGLDAEEIIGNLSTLLEGMQQKHKFNATVQIDEMFEIRYQKGNLKNQDIRISDETYSGKLTLWNNQIGDYKIGQTIQIENLYYDEIKQEFKTSFNSKINTNVQQKNLVSKHKPKKQSSLSIDGVDYQNFCYAIQLKQLIEIFQLQQEITSEIPYQYCRGIITEILASKLSQQCPTCTFTKLTQNNNIYECSGQNNVKHIVSIPKIFCYIKCKISDYTASVEAVFHDDVCQQYLSQNTMVELHKNQLSAAPYFDSLLYREFTFKLWLSKAKEQELKKIKIMKIFQSNYQKIIDSYL